MNYLFEELARITEELMSKKGVNFDSAFIMCNEMLTEITEGAIVIEPDEVSSIIALLRTRLNLAEDKGGAR